MGSEDEDPEDQQLRGAIDGSSELIGAIGGGAIGLVGGPVGSIAGAAAGVLIGKTIRRVGLEVYERLMAHRQKERVGAALAFALFDAEALHARGERTRQDGFFEAPEGLRSDAEDILEGVLLHAADAYQERKVRHLGAILPSLAVRPDVSAADGHWLTHIADRLTWRQLVILAIFVDPPQERLAIRDTGHDEPGERGPATGLRDEVEELGALGLLGVLRADGGVVRARGTWSSVGTIWDTPIAQWRLTTQGKLLVEVARLDDIPRDEREAVISDLLV